MCAQELAALNLDAAVVKKLLPKLTAKFADEIEAFLLAPDRKAKVVARVLELWDKYGEPLDLPGPDVITDPIIRRVLEGVVARLYDKLAAELLDVLNPKA